MWYGITMNWLCNVTAHVRDGKSLWRPPPGGAEFFSVDPLPRQRKSHALA
jgi:hypothetical protein